jgi:kynurenine formamidase
MIVTFLFNQKNFKADLTQPIDISLPIKNGKNNPTCYWAEPVKFEVITAPNFIGSVKLGGSVNHQKVTLTPHGNGTHTECFGHISDDATATINACHKQFHCIAELISITPEETSSHDFIIREEQVRKKITNQHIQALIIRTLPNTDVKGTKDYSGSNPPYIEANALRFLANQSIQHLLVDLPSVDREVDGGELSAHKAFWNFPSATRKECTITELVFIDNSIADGLYLLNLQTISLEIDASPSKPVLFKLKEVL